MPARGTLSDRSEEMFATYVETTLRRRVGQQPYAPEDTIGWLSWLAHHMDRHDQTVFYLEGLQRDSLPMKERWAFPLLAVAASVLFGGTYGSLYGGSFMALFGAPGGSFMVLVGNPEVFEGPHMGTS